MFAWRVFYELFVFLALLTKHIIVSTGSFNCFLNVLYCSDKAKLLWMSLSLHWVFRIGPSNLKVLNRICMLLKTFEWVIIIFTIFSVSSLLVTKINNQIPIICNTSIEWLADNCEYPLIELIISHPVKTYVKIFTIVGYYHQHMFGFRLDHPKSCLISHSGIDS